MNKLAAPRPPCPAALRPRPAATRPAGAWPGRRAAAGLLAGLALAGAPAVPAAAPADQAASALPAGLPAGLPDTLAADIDRLVKDAAAVVFADAETPPRIEVQLGRPDPRLRLAGCARVTPYLPAGTRPIGRTRIGLRCAQGPVAWNISLPLWVKVFAPALVAAGPLPAGTVLAAGHLKTAEVDLAERADPALRQASAVIGRVLAQGLSAGDALRRDDLKQRVWFATGDTVRVLAQGPGYAISSEGQALGPGLDGQAARVRTEGGRIITGIAAGERRVEVPL